MEKMSSLTAKSPWMFRNVDLSPIAIIAKTSSLDQDSSKCMYENTRMSSSEGMEVARERDGLWNQRILLSSDPSGRLHILLDIETTTNRLSFLKDVWWMGAISMFDVLATLGSFPFPSPLSLKFEKCEQKGSPRRKSRGETGKWLQPKIGEEKIKETETFY